MVSRQIFEVGRPLTFVIAACPVALTWRGCSFELRPQGDVWRGNATELGEILRTVLDSGCPVTLLLSELNVVDEAGAETIGRALAAAHAAGAAWTVAEWPAGRAVGASGGAGMGSECVVPAPGGLRALLRRRLWARARGQFPPTAADPQQDRFDVRVPTPTPTLTTSSDVRDAA